KKAEENLDRDDDELDRRGRKSLPFAVRKILPDQPERDIARFDGLFRFREPRCEFLKRAPRRELVVFRKPALGRKIQDELLNRGLHQKQKSHPDFTKNAGGLEIK